MPTPTSPAELREAVAARRQPALDPPAVSGPLTLTSVSPSQGLSGESIILEGTGFVSGIAVMLDGIRAIGVRAATDGRSVTAVAPFRAAGKVDVTVTNPGGESATLPQGFTYDVVTFSATPNRARPGEPLTVSWVVPGPRAKLDWIGLFEIGAPSTSYGHAWDYTDGRLSGTFTFGAPAVGQYEFRYLLNDGYNEVARTSPIVVSTGQ